MSLIFNQTLERLRVEMTTDRHGNDVPGDWDSAAAVPMKLWAIDAGDTSEDIESREGSVVEYTARKRGEADLRDSDRIRYRGTVYQIEGAIRFQPGPSRLTSHTIVRLRRAEG
jgi:hypothetical protein